jgi:hypothetical protein
VAIFSMTAVCSPRQEQADFTFSEPHPVQTHWTSTCQHETVPRLRKYQSGLRARMQCIKCGAGVGANVPMRGVVELWDEALQKAGEDSYDQACREWQKRRDEAWGRLRTGRSEAWWSAYSRYLQSAVWKRKRELVLRRNVRLHGGLCEACGENKARIVHHTEYPQTLGHEPLWVLRAVCSRCHEIFHPHLKESDDGI